jgi:predicted house-cleaning NTP pyrophosphatase (Maf/HAM1 superfamily)
VELVWHGAVETSVEMRPYSDDEIERYVGTGRPLDKAGAYAIQDPEFGPVARVIGCYPNVVGLPLCETRRALVSVGLLPEPPPDETDAIGSDRPECRLCVVARELEPPA